MPETPKISFVSLGCPKNLVDSEVMLGDIAKNGFYLCEDYADSDIIVINTCGFLEAAKIESVGVIHEALEMKKSGQVKGVVVTGCLPQRHDGQLPEGLEDVDAVIGLTDRSALAGVCETIMNRSHLEDAPQQVIRSSQVPNDPDLDRLRLTPRHYGYLKISEGCDHTCSFCIIPKIRGKFQSKPMEGVLDEVHELVADGAKEINIIAQDTTSYGIDIYRKTALPELLEQMNQVDSLEWIRLLYCYPTHVTDRLISAVRDLDKVVNYIDMPIQHTSEKMLRLMRRGVTEVSQRKTLDKLRANIPGVVLRTTVIVGFPGETEEDFEHLMRTVREIQFERLGAFRYSPEPGTRAYTMDGALSEDVIEDRYHRLMMQQQELMFDRNQHLVGTEVDVLIDTQTDTEHVWVGRTRADAPDIDGTIQVFSSEQSLKPGCLYRVRVTASQGYDLSAEICPEHTNA